MERGVVRRAKRDEVIGRVLSAFRARLSVMDIDERRAPTTRHPATLMIACEDLATHRGRDRLLGSTRAHVDVIDVPDVLRIALGHLDDFVAHLDELAPAVLPPLPALLANGQRHLITRTPVVPRPAECQPRQREQGWLARSCAFGVRMAINFAPASKRAHPSACAPQTQVYSRIAARARRVARSASTTIDRSDRVDR
jgi:hypothetical protein